MMEIGRRGDFEPGRVPTDPGVYLFKDREGTVIYCGKAKSLRSRVSTYFSSPERLTIKTGHLVARIRSIDWIVVGSEVEALLLENKLIKRYEPKYNINLKDAKTFAYIALTKDAFPRIVATRKAGANFDAFGPYTDVGKRRELQRLIVNIFKIRTCRTLPRRACLNYHIGICTAPCIGKVTREQYADQVRDAKAFLKGNVKQTVDTLTREMKAASDQGMYERALEFRNQIYSINLLTGRQIVDNERSYDQDVVAFRRSGDNVLVVQMGIRRGVLLGKKDFRMEYEENFGQEFLKAFYSQNQIPREIILGAKCWDDEHEKEALEEFFAHSRGAPVSLAVPSRGEKHALVELAERNIDVNMDHDAALSDLQNALNLPSLPLVIESFDISNIGREHVVSGMVRFVDGRPDKSGYRKFRIRTVEGADDFASMREVVYRRYKRLAEEGARMPDLILVDGGAEQLKSAMDSLSALGLSIPAIGLAKKFEEIYLPGERVPRRFDTNSRMMLLIRRIRDATHDFAIAYNRKRRQMKMREEFEG